MGMDKYVAYVSTYTMGDNHGIKIYDVDMAAGRLLEKAEIEITNSSYIVLSHNGKYLYSITDFGVESFKILEDGNLELINRASINGMRANYLSTDYTDRYLFAAGYHDGKITVLRINEQDGSVGEITDEVFHKGLGSVSERSFRPHISCARMTRDNHYLCAADLGIDYVNVYKFDSVRGTLKQADIVRCEIDTAPRRIKFSNDGRFMYVIGELKNCIDVYRYYEENNTPYFELVQTIPTTDNYKQKYVAASAMSMSADGQYILASNAGENSVALFRINQESGELERQFCLPISGEYPKDAILFPDNKHLLSLNHESNEMTFFTVDLDKQTMVMNGKPMQVHQGNCIVICKLNQ